MADAIETDAVIVGAGPVGLFQVFELGLLEMRAHVVDSLPHPGGQCLELYPDKPIYDIPAVQMCTGRELTERLLLQIKPFGTTFHLGQEVTQVHKRSDGRFDIVTSAGTRFLSKTLIIAGGVGSFQPRSLRVEGIDAYLNTQLFYSVQQPAQFAGKHLVVLGGGDAALDWAAHFATHPDHPAASVTLIHRRDQFQAPAAHVERVQALRDAGRLKFLAGQVVGTQAAESRLVALEVLDNLGVTHTVPADALLVFLGLSPKLGPIADWGLDLERKQVVVDTAKFETSVPGIFAVGDVNTYPGKKKLILCGFHEAALAAFGAAAYADPDRRLPLQYTTTSPKLHQALGVQAPQPDQG